MLSQVAKVSQGPSLHLSGYRVMKLTKILRGYYPMTCRSCQGEASDGVVRALGPVKDETGQIKVLHGPGHRVR